MIPKIKISIEKIDEYKELLEFVFLDDNIFKNSSFYFYPELKEILNNSKNKKKDLFIFFKNYEKQHEVELKNLSNRLEKLWNKYNDKFMKIFEEINEIKWTNKRKIFDVKITLSPLCPRFLDENLFYVFYKFDDKKLIEVILHEISHFIFFEKFKEIYPEVDSSNFESPNLIWKFSEIMPGIILQDKRFQDLYKIEEISVYDIIKKIKIKDRLILDIFKEFYEKKENFVDFVIKSYDLIKKNEEEFNSQFKV
ncbi:MAG: hypothetical protein PHT94_02985 [Candidatus Nanoarchaeia archaeon]|nr:hypothetical protein [Candidatus Nanoarchaeia archaeon]